MLVFNSKHKFVNSTHPKISRPYERVSFKTDASQVGLGAALTQECKIEGKKIFMTVLYASKSLKGTKRRYIVTNLEAPVAVWVVKKFS